MPAAYYSNQREEVLARVLKLPPGSVAEFGCGKGVFLQSLAGIWNQHHHFGVDLEAEEAGSTRNLTLRRSNILNVVPDVAAPFDYVLLLDVIEHFVDPHALFDHVKQFAGPHTIFIFSIPNIRFAVALFKIIVKKDFPEEAGGVFDKTHMRFYTHKKILRMLEANAFTGITTEGINSFAQVQPGRFRRTLARTVIQPGLSLLDRETVFQQYLITCRAA